MSEQPGEHEHLPRGHSGREHVKETGHRLALSMFTVSNCAECDWSSDADDFGSRDGSDV